MSIKILTVTGLALLCGWSAVQAQIPNASQQSDSVQQRQQLESDARFMVVSTNAAPEFYPGETSDVGPQTVVQRRPQTLFQASADEQYFYSDNVFLSDNHKQDADVLVSTLNLALTPRPIALAGGMLAPRLGYQQQWFNYGLAGDEIVSIQNFGKNPTKTLSGPIDTYDFSSITPFADATWTRGGWTATLGEDFRWLADSASYAEFYREFVTRWSVGRTFQVSDAVSIYAGYDGDYRFTDAHLPPAGYNQEFDDRTDQGLVFLGSLRLCSHMTLEPYDRLQYSCYTNAKRHDYLNSAGLSLSLQFTRQIALRAFASYNTMYTDGYYVQNYKEFDGGCGLNLSVQF